MQIINNLPNKTSCGFDGISTIVLKSINPIDPRPAASGRSGDSWARIHESVITRYDRS